ncbi:hypothetical protein Tco_1259480 [Tanacetum coccineum]
MEESTRMYPLTKYTLHQMFYDVKLQVDYASEMAFELLILKWNEVIDVDSLPDQVEPSNVPKPETVEPNVLASENINEIDDEDIPMAPFKGKKKDKIKITGTTRLCCLFDEDLSDQEEDLDEDSKEELKEDLHEDSSDQEEDLDEDSDSSDLEKYLGLFDESNQEEDLGQDNSDQDDSDDGWDLFYSEGISLWEEDNHNVDIVSNGVIVGEKVVDEIPNATVPVDDGVIGGEFADDEVPKERFKERVKIFGKRKLYQAFYEAEDNV